MSDYSHRLAEAAKVSQLENYLTQLPLAFDTHGGRIVEQGTHKQLVARQGHYYQLVKNQLEL